ncbi:MAG: hypothetical protein P9C48_09025 [Defluviicoccus sp.]|nr:hypothetical protein [Defluviicoccus sp.]MDG4609257.1 hypothetical protein [Defluviicoccus sp.]
MHFRAVMGTVSKNESQEASAAARKCQYEEALGRSPYGGGALTPTYPPGTTAVVGEDGKVIITIPTTPEKK